MIFECARVEDFQEVNRLARQVAEHHAQWDKSIQIVPEPYPMDWFLECIGEDSLQNSTIYVARKKDKVVGFMRFYLWETNSTVSEKRRMLTIDDLGVDQDLRSQGLGREMMEKLRKLAQKWNCESIRLYVDAENEGAYQYYLKCGFHVRNIGMGLDL